MKRLLTICIILSAIIMSAACGNPGTKTLLNQAETCMEEHPDSALNVIRAIDTNTLHSRALRARYSLLHATALDKNWIDTTDVGVVMPAVEWYGRHGDADQRMKTYYYLGRIQENGRDYNSAIISFTRSEAASSRSDNEGFKGLLDMAIAEIYKDTHLTDREREYIESGMEHFLSAGDSAHYRLSLGRLAMSFQERKEWSRADTLYKKVMGYAAQDTIAMAMFIPHYAAMKMMQPDPDPQGALLLLQDKVLKYKKSLSLKEYGIYAYAASRTGDDKTCDAILEMLGRQPDGRHTETRFYEYLIAKERGDYASALDLLTATYSDQDKKVDQLLNNTITNTLRDYFQTKATESKHQAEVQRLWFVSVLLCVVLAILVLAALSSKKRRRERQVADNLIRIAEESNAMLLQSKLQLEAKVERMEATGLKTSMEMQDKIASLQKAYIQLFKKQFDAVESLCKTYLKNQDKPESRRRDAVFSKAEDLIAFIGSDKKRQAQFEEHINRDLDNILAHLKDDLGELSDKDSRFICYTIAGFDPNIVAALLKLSLSNVYTKRTRLRDRIRKLDSPYKEQYLKLLES